MPLPDVVVNVRDAGQPRTLQTDTGTCYALGVAERGDDAAPIDIRSLDSFVTKLGARLANSLLYDFADTFFAEGGSRLQVQRVTSSTAVAATKTLLDGSAGNSLIVSALGKGVWGNSLSVQVVAGTVAGYVLVITRSAIEVERSPDLATQDDAVAWALANSNYVRIAKGASTLVPAVAAAAALTSGADGGALVDADWQTALDRIPADLGPGQIAIPGRTTSTGQLQVLAHAQASNRFALLDAPDSATVATITAAASSVYAAPNKGRRYGQMLAPWEIVPGVTASTTRTVPPSARAAAQYSRVDALGNPNRAAAGRLGVARFASDLSQPAWTDAQRKVLNEAGVTVSRRRYGNAIVTYGMRTLADQTADAGWSMAPNVRVVMAYVADARLVGDAHEFDQIDAGGLSLSALRGELISACQQLYTLGALYGATPDQAFYVDTGPGINTPQTIAAGEMHASVSLRTSPSAERVVIDVVKVPITQAVA